MRKEASEEEMDPNDSLEGLEDASKRHVQPLE
jgi:hypothetical protein